MNNLKMNSSKVSILTQIIPEISYDIIGRISPTVLLFLAILVDFGYFKPDKPLSIEKLLNISGGTWAALIIIIIGLGYAIGLVISNTSFILNYLFLTSVWKNTVGEETVMRVCKDLSKIYGKKYPEKWENFKRKDFLIIYTDSHDLTKRDSIYANNLLQKLSGEYLFFQTLSLASIIWFLFHWLNHKFILEDTFILLGLFLLTIFLAKERYKRLILRQLALFLYLSTKLEERAQN